MIHLLSNAVPDLGVTVHADAVRNAVKDLALAPAMATVVGTGERDVVIHWRMVLSALSFGRGL